MDKKSKKENKKFRLVPENPIYNDPVNKAGEIPTDILGSYTGVPLDGEQPIQDADDL